MCHRFLKESVAKSKMDDSKNLDVCKEFFELMCDDIVKERMRLGGDWIVNHGLNWLLFDLPVNLATSVAVSLQ